MLRDPVVGRSMLGCKGRKDMTYKGAKQYAKAVLMQV